MKTSINFKAVKSDSEIYALYKDLNDYLLFRNNAEIEKQQQIEVNPKQEQEESEINQANQTYKRKR